MSGRMLPRTLMLLLAALVGAAVPARAQEAPEVQWRNDYGSARKEAQEKKLPLVLDFVTRTCIHCNNMDKTTFRDPRIVSLLNERFIPLKVDGEAQANLTQALGISLFPTLVLAASDGKILHPPLVGYQEAGVFHEHLLRVLANSAEPDWMLRDHQLALKAVQTKDYARAITTLRRIVEDGKARPIQVSSHKTLQELESLGQERLQRAKEMFERGQVVEAMEAINDTIRQFPGLQVAREGSDMLARAAQSPELRNQQRSKRAKELLAQAQEFYKAKDYVPCLDRLEILMTSYGDLNEGQEASQISSNIKNDPDSLQAACETLSERLSNLYLAQADSWLRKDQPERARGCLQKVVQSFPGSRQAESAQIRLGQLAGIPARQIDAVSNKQ